MTKEVTSAAPRTLRLDAFQQVSFVVEISGDAVVGRYLFGRSVERATARLACAIWDFKRDGDRPVQRCLVLLSKLTLAVQEVAL